MPFTVVSRGRGGEEGSEREVTIQRSRNLVRLAQHGVPNVCPESKRFSLPDHGWTER